MRREQTWARKSSAGRASGESKGPEVGTFQHVPGTASARGLEQNVHREQPGPSLGKDLGSP